MKLFNVVNMILREVNLLKFKQQYDDEGFYSLSDSYVQEILDEMKGFGFYQHFVNSYKEYCLSFFIKHNQRKIDSVGISVSDFIKHTKDLYAFASYLLASNLQVNKEKRDIRGVESTKIKGKVYNDLENVPAGAYGELESKEIEVDRETIEKHKRYEYMYFISFLQSLSYSNELGFSVKMGVPNEGLGEFVSLLPSNKVHTSRGSVPLLNPGLFHGGAEIYAKNAKRQQPALYPNPHRKDGETLPGISPVRQSQRLKTVDQTIPSFEKIKDMRKREFEEKRTIPVIKENRKNLLKEITVEEATQQFNKYVKVLHNAGLYKTVKEKVLAISQSEQIPGKLYDNFLKFAVVLVGMTYERYNISGDNKPTERFMKGLDSYIQKVYQSYLSNTGQETTEGSDLQPYTREENEMGRLSHQYRLAISDLARSISSQFGEVGTTVFNNFSDTISETLKSKFSSIESYNKQLGINLNTLSNLLKANGLDFDYSKLKFRDPKSRETILQLLTPGEVIPEPKRQIDKPSPRLDSQVLRRQGEQKKYVTPRSKY